MKTIYTLLNIGFKLTSYVLSVVIYFSLVYLLAKELRYYITKNYRTFLILTNTRFINLSYCDMILYAGSLILLATVTAIFYSGKASLILLLGNLILLAMMLVCFEIKFPRKSKLTRIIRCSNTNN